MKDPGGQGSINQKEKGHTIYEGNKKEIFFLSHETGHQMIM